jgi:DNA polymerase-3 subunit delta
MMVQARKYRLAEFLLIFERLFTTDLALKTGGGKPSLLMERLVMAICDAKCR